MADKMEFPKTMREFIVNYSFKDSAEVYTNGAELVPVFRVEQALEHYEKEIRNKALDEFAERLNSKISDFVLEHKDNIDFASGISVAWNLVDEIAEELKGVQE